MKSLETLLTEALVVEAFGSKIIASLMKNVGLKSDWWHSRSYLQWDKVKDEDIREITKEEAMKLYRKQKDPHYILWVSNNHREGERISLITWGTDLITCEWGYARRGTSTKSVIDSMNITKAYDVIDFEKFFRVEMMRQRAEAKKDALALKSAEEVLVDNKKRYESILAKMHTGNKEEVAKIFGDIMVLYEQVTKQWVTKYMDQILQEQPDMWQVRRDYVTIQNKISNMMDAIQTYSINGKHGWDARYTKQKYDEIKKLADEITKLCMDKINAEA